MHAKFGFRLSSRTCTDFDLEVSLNVIFDAKYDDTYQICIKAINNIQFVRKYDPALYITLKVIFDIEYDNVWQI